MLKNVISLFDGISCARLALEKNGIKPEKYYASEIDKYAVSITQKNFPDTIQVGDVTKLKGEDFNDVDLIIGGSPCQDLSIAKKDRQGLKGQRSGLFYEFVRMINEVKPKYFVLENVNSMPKEAKEQISEILGLESIMINASLVSAQNRKRLFWVGKLQNDGNYKKVEIAQPEDKGIILRDILEEEVDEKYNVSSKHTQAMINTRKTKTLNIPKEDGKCGTITASYYKIPNDGNYIQVGIIKEEIKTFVKVRKYEVDIAKLKSVLKEHKNLSNRVIAEMLNLPVTKVEHWFRNDNCFAIPDEENWLELKALLQINTDEFDKSIMEFEIKEGNFDSANRLYSEEGKSPTLTNSPIKLGHLNKGGQGDRIYSQEGKSVTLSANGGGRGAKTGLYVTNEYNNRVMTEKCGTLGTTMGRTAKQGYQVVNEEKKQIRKLTPTECERLQCVPDKYTELGINEKGEETKISDTQRYKVLGNGYNVDVVAHIIKFLD